MALTVADMNRLEEAARLSMGSIQDAEAATTAPSHGRPLGRIVFAIVGALLVLAAAYHLL